MNGWRKHGLGLALVAAVASVALATPAAPTAAAASSGTNLIVNGSFEHHNGYQPLHWTTSGAANDFSGGAYKGLYHMDLVVGSPLPSVASVSQTVTIPASIQSAKLTFWTEDWSCGADIHFDVEVITGDHVHVVKTIPGAACGPGYVRTKLSLLRFEGKTVTLLFSTTYVSGVTGSLFYLDAVSLRVS
jgi:hypothetical protein